VADVVISYARENEASAHQLGDAIARQGYSVWRDDSAAQDAASADAAAEQIGIAKAVIVIWSEASAGSEWVKAEANVARGLKKLIQVSADGRPPPIPFDRAQMTSILTWRGDDEHPGWRNVQASLATLCGPPPAPEATIPVAAAPPAPAPEPAPVAPPADEQYTRRAVVQDGAGYAVVRNAPTELGFAVARVNAGESLAVGAQSGGWWQVRTASGRTGYVAASSLRLGATPPPGAALPSGQAPVAMPPPPRPPRPARPPAEQRPRSRIVRENSKVMSAFCADAGRGTSQCRAYRRAGGD
jgi:hypothetical protein